MVMWYVCSEINIILYMFVGTSDKRSVVAPVGEHNCNAITLLFNCSTPSFRGVCLHSQHYIGCTVSPSYKATLWEWNSWPC